MVSRRVQKIHQFVVRHSEDLLSHISCPPTPFYPVFNLNLYYCAWYTEFRIELQWKYNVSSLEFPHAKMVDRDGRPARQAGYVKLTKEAILSTNTSGLSGNCIEPTIVCYCLLK